MPRKEKDLVGQQFGRLTVIEKSNHQDKYGRCYFWKCRCSCGNIKIAWAPSLKKGCTQSCGCLALESLKSGIRNYKHGDTNKTAKFHKLYHIWYGIRKRCNNESDRVYKYYGGRGIKICSEWNKSYPAFKVWALANGYQKTLTLDRIKNDQGYNPENCQWISRSKNSKKVAQDRKLAIEKAFIRGMLVGFLKGYAFRKNLLAPIAR